jgi:hypothetical protein
MEVARKEKYSDVQGCHGVGDMREQVIASRIDFTLPMGSYVFFLTENKASLTQVSSSCKPVYLHVCMVLFRCKTSLKTPHCVISSTCIPSRDGDICTNLLNHVVTEEQDFEGDSYPQVDECKENDNQAGSFCFSLTIIERLRAVLREIMRLTVARIGYMFAARNQPERPKAMPTSTQRTIGTGITQSTYS